MIEFSFLIGISVALILIPLLLKTAWQDDFRVWPTPAPWSWQSITFWTLFRSLNVATIVTAILSVTIAEPARGLGLPIELRAAAFSVMLVCLGWYVQSLVSLGKENTYCEANGLITGGIYRWTRNPQYATIIPFYMTMALAGDDPALYLLAAAMCSVYYLMAVVEEPWLAAAYGKGYAEYCRRVPRFFNFRRAAVWFQAQLRAAQRLLNPG